MPRIIMTPETILAIYTKASRRIYAHDTKGLKKKITDSRPPEGMANLNL